jgi:hypothetical protein
MTGSLCCFTASLMRLSSRLGKLIDFSRAARYPTLPSTNPLSAVHFFKGSGRFYRARVLPFKRAKIQTSVESLKISPIVGPDQQED